MSIRQKMLLPMVLLTVLSILAVLGSVIVSFSKYVDESIDAEIGIYAKIMERETEDIKETSEFLALSISENPEMVDAITSKNRATIISCANDILDESGMDFCTVTDQNGNVLARTHNEQRFNDSVAGNDGFVSALSGRQLTSIETGNEIALSIRSTAPVYSESGDLMGAISVGVRLDTNDFVDRMEALMGAEFTVFLGGTRLSTTITDEGGNRISGTQAADTVIAKVIDQGQIYSGNAQILGKDALVCYLPIKSASGDPVGMLFAGKYNDVKINAIRSFLISSLIVIVIMMVIAIPAALYVSKRTVAPIYALVGAADKIAAGDIAIDIQINTKDETKTLAASFRRMVDGFQEQARVLNLIAEGDYSPTTEILSEDDVVGKAIVRILDNNNLLIQAIKSSSEQVADVSQQIAQGSQSLASGATEQAASIEELSSAIEEVLSQSEQTAGEASLAFDEVREAGRLMGESMQSMDRMTHAMQDISESSYNISKIIEVIDDIAFQTNILALNAAVEAARAGQYGKGFAVVAEEVRGLASKSADAASETAALIERSINKVNEGNAIVAETSASLSSVAQIAASNADKITRINELAQNQNAAIAEITQGINQISTVVQANSATSEESAAAAEEMSSQAAILGDIVSRFKLRDSGPVLIGRSAGGELLNLGRESFRYEAESARNAGKY